MVVELGHELAALVVPHAAVSSIACLAAAATALGVRSSASCAPWLPSPLTTLVSFLPGESDYRYFPEPDIPPLSLSDDLLEHWRSELCELPGDATRFE